jgi:chromate transporter
MSEGALALVGPHGLGWGDLLQLMLHFMMLSLLAVGGAITTAPDMQRWLVQQQGWLTDAQFSASVALAQAAPGPNILFVALLGWSTAGAAGLLATMVGIMAPSSLLTVAVARWGRARRDALLLRAFTAGMAPITIGLLLSTGWILAQATHNAWGSAALIAATVWATARSKLAPLWLIGGGAVLGAFGGA